jgi:hypothetical protein
VNACAGPRMSGFVTTSPDTTDATGWLRRPRWHSHAQLYEREGIRQVSGVKKVVHLLHL